MSAIATAFTRPTPEADPPVLNYINYFTEVEQRFQQRRGSILMLSTLDWALIETWRDSGVPLAAVLRGIDEAFDRHDAKQKRTTRRLRQVNGLAWCAQAVMEAVERASEASTGMAASASQPFESGYEAPAIAEYLEENATLLEACVLPGIAAVTARESAARLRALAGGVVPASSLEELDRSLTVLEEKLFATLQVSVAEDVLVGLREKVAGELAPYRGRMQAVQIKQVQQQMLQKRLFETLSVPRLSLFAMRHR